LEITHAKDSKYNGENITIIKKINLKWIKSPKRIVVSASSRSSASFRMSWSATESHIQSLLLEKPFAFFKFINIGLFLSWSKLIISFSSDSDDVWRPHVRELLFNFYTLTSNKQIISISRSFLWDFIIISLSNSHLLSNFFVLCCLLHILANATINTFKRLLCKPFEYIWIFLMLLS